MNRRIKQVWLLASPPPSVGDWQSSQGATATRKQGSAPTLIKHHLYTINT